MAIAKSTTAKIIPFPADPWIRRTAVPQALALLRPPSNTPLHAVLSLFNLSESQFRVLLGCDETDICSLLDVYYSDLKSLEKRSLVHLHLPGEGHRGRWTITRAGSVLLQSCQIMLHES
jgi:hypothetical protein